MKKNDKDFVVMLLADILLQELQASITFCEKSTKRNDEYCTGILYLYLDLIKSLCFWYVYLHIELSSFNKLIAHVKIMATFY